MDPGEGGGQADTGDSDGHKNSLSKSCGCYEELVSESPKIPRVICRSKSKKNYITDTNLSPVSLKMFFLQTLLCHTSRGWVQDCVSKSPVWF